MYNDAAFVIAESIKNEHRNLMSESSNIPYFKCLAKAPCRDAFVARFPGSDMQAAKLIFPRILILFVTRAT